MAAGDRRARRGGCCWGEGVCRHWPASSSAWLRLAYTVLLLHFLAAVWPGGALQSFLKPHFEDSGLSLTIGGGSSLLVAVLSMGWSLLGLGRVASARS